MILIWDFKAYDRRCAYTMQCQLKFYFNQCYNPSAHHLLHCQSPCA